MRIPPIAPPRRPLPRHRDNSGAPVIPGPTPAERRLIDRIMQRSGYRESR
ncbi:hypothetical protein [Sphingopyxis macrogoltabida]|nr:hypothetical protein [Sphingopyxis macrogoltabida]